MGGDHRDPSRGGRVIRTRTSIPFGRLAPRVLAPQGLSGIQRIAASFATNAFFLGTGVRTVGCSGTTAVQVVDGNVCATAGTPICVGRSNGKTFEVPCPQGVGGGGGEISFQTASAPATQPWTGPTLLVCSHGMLLVYTPTGAYVGTLAGLRPDIDQVATFGLPGDGTCPEAQMAWLTSPMM